MEERLTGVLLPVFSLPNGPIGNFGISAYQWIDLLKKNHFNAWQICPLGPTGFGYSPYQPLSEFALNPLFVDIEALCRQGWLDKSDVPATSKATYVDYAQAQQQLFPLWMKAYERFCARGKKTVFQAFKEKEAHWLMAFSTFCALKLKFNDAPWWSWPKDLRQYNTPAVQQYQKEYCKMVDFFAFQQWICAEQWEKVHAYAQKQNICIVGDIPLYVGPDSAIVWQNRALFDWDYASDRPRQVAGVPPDYFSAEGQLWGNPLYNWDWHRQTQFQWWVSRIRKNFEWCDVLRIDHFRGLYDYWAVSWGEKTAQRGQWLPGPQDYFFQVLKQHWPHMPFILEDLGDLHAEVRAFEKRLQIPGMAIMQFAFDGDENPYLPQHWAPNAVVYTGTHDNNTTRGWFSSLNKAQRDQVKKTMHRTSISVRTINHTLISWLLAQRTTQHIIFPLQDLLDLGSEARINTPGTLKNNWCWRCPPLETLTFSTL